MAAGVIGSERVRQALMPTEAEKAQRTIEDLKKKLAAAEKQAAAKKSGLSAPIPTARPPPRASRGAQLAGAGRK